MELNWIEEWMIVMKWSFTFEHNTNRIVVHFEITKFNLLYSWIPGKRNIQKKNDKLKTIDGWWSFHDTIYEKRMMILTTYLTNGDPEFRRSASIFHCCSRFRAVSEPTVSKLLFAIECNALAYIIANEANCYLHVNVNSF